MEYLLSNLKLFGILFIISVFCTVMFTEIVKKIDTIDVLKGYKVWLPLLFSCGFSVAIKFVMKVDWLYMIFIESSLFGFSVFNYEVVLKSLNRIYEKIMNKVNNLIENIDSNKKD